MKRLTFSEELQNVMSDKTPVYAIIHHKLHKTIPAFDLHKGTLCGAGGGKNGRFVCFIRDSDKAEWDLPVESCFIDDNPPHVGPEKEE